MSQNKVLEFIEAKLQYYFDQPVESLFDEGELNTYSLNKREKLIKKVSKLLSDISTQHSANASLYNDAADDMNNIEEEIIGVIEGKNLGRTGGANGASHFVLVCTTKNVHVYTAIDFSAPGVWESASFITALGSLFTKSIKHAKEKFHKETYSLNEFLDTALIGNTYADWGEDIANWSYGGFFKKYKVLFIMRPMYRQVIDVVQQVVDGTYKSTQETTVSSNLNYIEELKQLKELLNQEIITEEEFNAKKTEILKKNS